MEQPPRNPDRSRPPPILPDIAATLQEKAASRITVGITLAFAIGIVTGNAAGPEPIPILAAILLNGLAILLLFYRGITAGKLQLSLCLLLFLLLGCLYGRQSQAQMQSPTHIFNKIKSRQEATVEGILLKAPSTLFSQTEGKTRTRLQVSATGIYLPASGPTMVPVTGLVQLLLQDQAPRELRPGDRFIARARLSRVYPVSTPGVFNYREHLARQGIWLTGQIASRLQIIPVTDQDETTLSGRIQRIRYLPERIRYQISLFLADHLDSRSGGLYKAILIGDRGGLDPEMLENFTAAGCVHILAISGMHMGLLAVITTTLLIWLFKHSDRLILQTSIHKLAFALALAPLTGYALIAGFNIPVVRALLMVIALAGSLLWNRHQSPLANLSLAALVILIWQPTSIFTVSFQLSFAAVIAIGLVLPLITRQLNDKWKAGSLDSIPVVRWFHQAGFWCLAATAVSIAAVIGCGPLLLYYFNRISLLSPLANLVVEPLVCFISLFLGLAAIPLIPFQPGLAAILLKAGSQGLLAANSVCGYFSSLPLAQLWLPSPAIPAIIIYYLALGGIIYSLTTRLNRHRRKLFLTTAGLSLLLAITEPVASRPADKANVTFLDVGQGSSTLLQAQSGNAILIDGGGPSSENFNVGSRIIAPFLWSRRIKRLDAVIATHPHTDHFNGLQPIIERFRPGILWVNGQTPDDPAYAQLLACARQNGTRIRVAIPGETMWQEDDAQLQCLVNKNADSPLTGKRHQPALSTNDLSLILQFTANGKSFLFPGDSGPAIERDITRAVSKTAVDVLLAPHHGSRISNSPQFIGQLAPAYLVVSAGRFNNFGVPDPNLKALSRQAGFRYLATGENGTITFTFNELGLQAKGYLAD